LISGFRRDVDVICGLLGNYTASCGNYLPTFWDNVSVPSSWVKIPSRKGNLDPRRWEAVCGGLQLRYAGNWRPGLFIVCVCCPLFFQSFRHSVLHVTYEFVLPLSVDTEDTCFGKTKS
jgi:hypothetical protein